MSASTERTRSLLDGASGGPAAARAAAAARSTGSVMLPTFAFRRLVVMAACERGPTAPTARPGATAMTAPSKPSERRMLPA